VCNVVPRNKFVAFWFVQSSASFPQTSTWLINPWQVQIQVHI
jgi:hypothetical protein